jgi:hypothetical protein
MSTTLIVIIVATIVVLGAAAAWFYLRRRRSLALRQRFGPEYDRTLRAVGAPAEAETLLQERTKRVEQFRITPLSAAQRDEFNASWRRVQALFVDEPGRAVVEADRMITSVMRTRGYPVEADFERRAEDLSVHHARVVQHYRAGRELAVRHERGAATTENLRQAMVHFRELFEELVANDAAGAPAHTRRAS